MARIALTGGGTPGGGDIDDTVLGSKSFGGGTPVVTTPDSEPQAQNHAALLGQSWYDGLQYTLTNTQTTTLDLMI